MERRHEVGTGAPPAEGSRVLLVLAFLTIYVVWGTTFLAIRVAVGEIPPFLAAGIRFAVAGGLLFGWTRVRGMRAPTSEEWRNLLVIAALMFGVDYGALFWAEREVPSGMASVLIATMPLMTIALEMLVFRLQPFRAALLLPIALGFAGTAVLLWTGAGGAGRLPVWPSVAILCGAMGWAVGSVLQRRMRMPEAKAVGSGATMLLGGGMLLLLAAGTGEMRAMPQVTMRGVGAMLYLIVFGSILGFTAFVWLLARLPATVVSSHAYVNPVVAVAVGWLLAGELVTTRTLVGAAIVVLSVGLVLRRPAARAEVATRDAVAE